jgi:hypothetical protein
VRQSLLLVVLLGPAPDCQVRLPDAGAPLVYPLPCASPFDMSPVSPVARPKQSWQYLGEEEVQVERYKGILCIERLPGVIRKDNVDVVSVRACRERGGAACILAERLLPELAYKMGRASKYGS